MRDQVGTGDELWSFRLLVNQARAPRTPYLPPRPYLRAGFLPSEDPAQVFFERGQKRLFSQRPGGMLVGMEEFYVFCSNHPGEECTPVGGQLQEGSHLHQCVVPDPGTNRTVGKHGACDRTRCGLP